MKVFWDTNLFIYQIEKKSFQKEMKILCDSMETQGYTLFTSSLTAGEILVQPKKNKNQRLVEDYLHFFRMIRVIDFDFKAAEQFADLRSKYPSLRPPDAIQISCALRGECDYFYTNDNRLSDLRIKSALQIRSLIEQS